MATDFKRGDHVEWNSEAGRFRGTIQKKVTRPDSGGALQLHVHVPAPGGRAVGISARRADSLADDAGRATRRPPTGPLAGGASGPDSEPDGARDRKHYSFCRIGFLTSAVPPVATGDLCRGRSLAGEPSRA